MRPTQKRSVLIADNNEFYRKVLGDLYSELRFEVRVAADGLEALLQITERRPDLVVLDLIMPRIDGARLCSYIKAQDRFEGLPVIILSGILADEIDGVEQIQADAYIAKMPFEQIRDTLCNVTETLLKRCTGEPLLRGFEKMYRREVVLELLEERRSRQGILDSLSEGIGELSPDHLFLTANRALQEIIGARACDLVSRSLEEVLSDAAPVLNALFQDLDRGIEVAQTRITRSGRDLQIKLHRFEPGGTRGGELAEAIRRAAGDTEKVRLAVPEGEPGYTVLVEDITEHVAAERERESLRQRAAHAEKMSALGLFVSGAAHELNNPLTGVLGYAQLLLQKAGGGETAAELEKIIAGAQRCRQIVESLAAFARGVKPRKAIVDLNATVMETLADHREALAAAGVALEMDLCADLPTTQADAAQIGQAFGLIVDNALKALADATGPGRRLTVSTRLCHGAIQIEFADSGPGIPDEILRRIFDPFVTTRSVGQGPGLGLSMAYGIVTAHQGRIRAHNRSGSGASILMELPVVDEQTSAPRRLPERAAPAEKNGSSRILIADDEAVVVDLLSDILEMQHHVIETATSGAAAYSKIMAGEYDLVILDLRMPDMTGQQLYEELKRNRPEMLGRLLFVTADTVSQDVKSFLQRAGSPYLKKPFSVQSVVDTVQTILAGGGVGLI
ncbi:MAG TPA: response regulator [Candidatus Polarisedimenticolia bacterium]|nr:response regulator [Candidatus Polarisedimenticolia bacterium]